MDTLRNDLVSHTDPSLDEEQASHELFLLEEGLELLARYRTIGDPQVRLLIRQLIAGAADGQTREQ